MDEKRKRDKSAGSYGTRPRTFHKILKLNQSRFNYITISKTFFSTVKMYQIRGITFHCKSLFCTQLIFHIQIFCNVYPAVITNHSTVALAVIYPVQQT